MISFKEYLEEGYKNLFTDSQKRKLLSGHREANQIKQKGALRSLFLWFR